jgi:hypothetical protein
MIAQSPQLRFPVACAVCGILTRQPYYRHVYSNPIPYCETDARCFAEGFTGPAAIVEAQVIIRACNQVWRATR